MGYLGPGLIVASALVGSGELIATTKTGAQAGISLLWLIVLGCVIKVFVQIELARYTISRGETTLVALNSVPGPRLRVGWIVWLWAFLSLAAIGVQGAIVGGVGQALAMLLPLRGDYIGVVGREMNHAVAANMPFTYDDKIWATIATAVTAGLLYRGRYNLIQSLSTVLVAMFTVLTIGNVVSLQTTEEFHIPMSDIARGLSFGAPELVAGKNPWLTALATFGIIGVGAGELLIYPYWCLERGYARFVGPHSDDDSWARRARGWMRVVYFDAFGSMILYTLVTVAFFLMGVAVLHPRGLDPDGMQMVSTLAEAYVPVFGAYARWLFLLGAIAVLYSTFLIANASYARIYTDALKVFGVMSQSNTVAHDRAVSAFSVVLPFVALAVYLVGTNPVSLILLGGLLNGVLLPVIGFSTIYFRYTQTDHRLRPGLLWDTFLILSCVGVLIVGLYGIAIGLYGIASRFW